MNDSALVGGVVSAENAAAISTLRFSPVCVQVIVGELGDATCL